MRQGIPCQRILKDKEEKWLELNATHQEIRTAPIPEGQEVVIVIGEEMNEAKIRGYFPEN